MVLGCETCSYFNTTVSRGFSCESKSALSVFVAMMRLTCGSRLRTGSCLPVSSRLTVSRTRFTRRAVPDGGEEISDAMKADLARYQQRQPASQQASSSTKAQEEPSSLKEALDKVLIADFFLVLFILAWLGAGVAQSALTGGSSFLLDAWYPLWPLLWQPAIGILMAGALVSGGINWLQEQSDK